MAAAKCKSLIDNAIAASDAVTLRANMFPQMRRVACSSHRRGLTVALPASLSLAGAQSVQSAARRQTLAGLAHHTVPVCIRGRVRPYTSQRHC
jgi:hypothetical protein